MPNFNKLYILFSVESKEVVLLAFLNITNIKKTVQNCAPTAHAQYYQSALHLHCPNVLTKVFTEVSLIMGIYGENERPLEQTLNVAMIYSKETLTHIVPVV